jgi:hypothetical protein
MINMAKRKKSKKKGTKRRRSTKKVKRRTVKKKAAGAMLGVGISTYKVATDKEGTGISPVEAVFYPYDSTKTKVEAIVRKVVSNVMETKNSGPALIGIGLSFGKDLPLIGQPYNEFLYKPMNRMFGKLQTALTGKKARYRL